MSITLQKVRTSRKASLSSAKEDMTISAVAIPRLILPVVGLGAMLGLLTYILYFADDPSTPQLIPVIKAESGPVRIKPQNPGGQAVPHQDKLVYTRLGNNPVVEPTATLLPPAEDPMTEAIPQPPVVESRVLQTVPTREETSQPRVAPLDRSLETPPQEVASESEAEFVSPPNVSAHPKSLSTPKITGSSVKKTEPSSKGPSVNKATPKAAPTKSLKIRGDILGRLRRMQTQLKADSKAA
jgi:hypothetical protein